MANFSIIKYLPKCTTVKKKDFRTEQLELLVLLRNHSTMKKHQNLRKFNAILLIRTISIKKKKGDFYHT